MFSFVQVNGGSIHTIYVLLLPSKRYSIMDHIYLIVEDRDIHVCYPEQELNPGL